MIRPTAAVLLAMTLGAVSAASGRFTNIDSMLVKAQGIPDNTIGTGIGLDTTNIHPYNYSIQEGQWIKYGPFEVEVNSDSEYLELVLKGMLSRGFFALPSSMQSVGINSMDDIEWLLINISKIQGDDISTLTTIKPKFSESNYSAYGVMNLRESSLFNLYLPEGPKIGQKIYTTFAGEPFPLVISNMTEKVVGGRVVNGYGSVGTKNTYNETNLSATEVTIHLFNDEVYGRPLDVELEMRLGTMVGIINLKARISAMDWSG